MITRSAALAVSATVVLATTPASAQVVTWPDWVDVGCPVGSLEEGNTVTGDRACVVEEQTLVVPDGTPADIVDPGNYDYTRDTLPVMPAFVAESTRVKSFLLHRDVEGMEGQPEQSGTVTVSTDIVAILLTASALDPTDDVFGDARYAYPGGAGDRGTLGTDAFLLAPGRRTVDIRIRTQLSGLDQFRLLVRAPPDAVDAGPSALDAGRPIVDAALDVDASGTPAGAGDPLAGFTFDGGGGCACEVPGDPGREHFRHPMGALMVLLCLVAVRARSRQRQ